MVRYQKILEAFLEKPWAILPSKLAQISELLIFRSNGGMMTPDEIRAAMEMEPYHDKFVEARAQRNREKTGGKVAILPIYGVITPRADVFSQMSGGTGMDQFMEALNAAANDPSVGHIVLDVDSPGGQVDLVPEAAALIRQVRAKKPITAVANTMAASAAYWLASQASSLVISPSAEVGSIGVYAAHQDVSEAQARLGVKTTLIAAGKYKTELDPTRPLSDEARAYVQSQVDEYYGMFTKDVAAGRNVSVNDVRGGFGEGRMLTADKAVKAGMADRVETFDATIGRALKSVSAAQPMAEYVPLHFGTAGTATTYTFDFTPTSEIAGNFPANEDSDSEPATVADEEPSTDVASLRQTSREAAIQERREYLALLRRINK